MKIFKFGGASVKDAQGIENVAHILKKYSSEQLIVVVSAIGKTTNKLENVVSHWYKNEMPLALEQIFELKAHHEAILLELNITASAKAEINNALSNWFEVLIETLKKLTPGTNYNLAYDQIVSFGELIGTTLVAKSLYYLNVDITWADVRPLIRTNDCFRDGRVQWEETQQAISSYIDLHSAKNMLVQGFLGSDISSGLTTTLGREGSDFTASIFAYCLNAASVTIWKDVPGVLNADPRLFPHAILIKQLSYQEAVEMTYYGASVIHPKTIKPLQNKNISLHVRSFLDTNLEGTTIGNDADDSFVPPSIIVKNNQCLLAFGSKDFSFIAEESLAAIFAALYKMGIKVHLMQNSALSFCICVDQDPYKLEPLIQDLEQSFNISKKGPYELITIRNASEKLIQGFVQGRDLILEQKLGITTQLVLA